jgi:hypothetical protein
MILIIKKILPIIILLINIQNVFSQSNDSLSKILIAKMYIMMYEHEQGGAREMTYDYIKRFLDFVPEYKILKSKGFGGDFTFFEIQATQTQDSVYSKIVHDSINKRTLYYNRVFFEGLDHSFIFVCGVTGFYKLKGFPENDFARFYSDVKRYYKREYNDSYYFKSKKRFLENFYIENVDLECLYDYCIKKRTRNKSCVQPARLNKWWEITSHTDYIAPQREIILERKNKSLITKNE